MERKGITPIATSSVRKKTPKEASAGPSKRVPYTLRVTAEEKTDIQMIPPPVITFDKRIKNPQKGWYKGELHVHSTQSTGREGIKSLLAFCRDHAIDFIAFTDHFTASHWEEIERTDSDLLPLCLRSMEISGDKGHMNAHGLSSWINPLVDDNEWLGFTTPPSMVSIADEVHRQGGIVSINHPLSGLVSWHYPDFPMEKADLLEIWCTADYQTTALYPTFWDQYLKMGLHITGVGSSDSHHSTDIPGWQMGKIHTWVLADNLGQEALIKALKSGQAYVSYGKSELRFEAHTPSHCYQMGETIKKGETPSFFITLLHHPSGHLIIYRDGFQEDSVYFPEEEESHYSFTLPSFSYCRIEFHEDIKKTRFWGMVFRDWQSMRLLSNPIWMEK